MALISIRAVSVYIYIVCFFLSLSNSPWDGWTSLFVHSSGEGQWGRFQFGASTNTAAGNSCLCVYGRTRLCVDLGFYFSETYALEWNECII